MVHDGVACQPARHRLVVPVEQLRCPRAAGPAGRALSAGELRDTRTDARARQAAAPAVAAGNRREFLRRGALLGAERSTGVAPVHRPLPEARAPRRRTDRPGARHPALQTAGRGQHGCRLHLRPRRVRCLAWNAGKGRGRLRGGDPGTAGRQGPARRARRRTIHAAHRSHLERRLHTAAADDRDWLERLAERIRSLADRAPITTWPGCSRTRAPRAAYVAHCTDEIVTEFAIELYAANAPLHVTAIRTPKAKYAMYSNWQPATNMPLSAGQEASSTTTRRRRLAGDRQPRPPQQR